MKDLTGEVLQIMPILTCNSKKGDHGVIGIIGGSYEYTGAPYYAAISALKMGADLVHIFCSKSAATPIKTYSPQIIVHPVFVSSEQIEEDGRKMESDQINQMQQKWVQKISKFHQRISAWVIGPGLGRDIYLQGFFKKLILSFSPQTLLVLDADALYFTCQHPQLLPKLQKMKTIMTPNHREFHHLNKILKIEQHEQEISLQKQCEIIAIKQQEQVSITLIKKGQIDHIMAPGGTYLVQTTGGNKRCGGIGDILAGIVGVCSYWDLRYGPLLACHITKLVSRAAFQKEGRSLTAPSIIQQLPQMIKFLQSQQSIKPSI